LSGLNGASEIGGIGSIELSGNCGQTSIRVGFQFSLRELNGVYNSTRVGTVNSNSNVDLVILLNTVSSNSARTDLKIISLKIFQLERKKFNLKKYLQLRFGQRNFQKERYIRQTSK
jgi:hypothetical protein